MYFYPLLSGFLLKAPGVTDIDGHLYDTIHFRGYAIMVDRLRTTHFNDGEEIPYVKKDEDWNKSNKLKAKHPAYCYLDHSKKNQKQYGNLYNYTCLDNGNDVRLAPQGWHVPTYDEWIEIFGKTNNNLAVVSGKNKPKDITREATTAENLRWKLNLTGGGYRKSYDGKFFLPHSSFIHLTDGNVIVNDEQMKTIDGHHVNGPSVICIKKLE